tara:strand:+ start:8328 stop:8699 length:372 start_codon:yes stop_codon:yes gene_type:complete
MEKLAYSMGSDTDEQYFAEKHREVSGGEEVVETTRKNKKKALLAKKLSKKKKDDGYVMPVDTKSDEVGDDSDVEQQKVSWQIKVARASHMANPILSIRLKKKPKKFGKPSTILPTLLAKSYRG